jgi:hypothetical protein
MRGRKPIPTRLRLIRGNPSKRPILPEPEPTLPSVPPEPPPYLTGHGAGEWRRLAPGLHRLGLLSVLDTATRPGAAANIGTEVVVKAPPDGYTILMAARRTRST